jgi:hypothetical protein
MLFRRRRHQSSFALSRHTGLTLVDQNHSTLACSLEWGRRLQNWWGRGNIDFVTIAETVSNFNFGPVFTFLPAHPPSQTNIAKPLVLQASHVFLQCSSISERSLIVESFSLTKSNWRVGDLSETYWERKTEVHGERPVTALCFHNSHVHWLETELYLKVQLVHAASTPSRSVVTIVNANRLALVWRMKAVLRYVLNFDY